MRLSTPISTVALSFILLAAGAAAIAQTSEEAPDPAANVVTLPAVDLAEQMLEGLRTAQIAGAGRLEVFHQFQFTDRIDETGIAFQHRAVEDAGKRYKMVHYDHGNGIAVADVDSDGLYDIYFSSQLGGDELWKNLGGGRFENVTAEAGLAGSGRVGVTAAFADIDNDGDPDLYVTSVRTGNALFENNGTGRFKEITAEAGLSHSGHSSGATFFDYDRDGRLDLFLANVGVYTTAAQGPGKYWVGFQNAFDGHLHAERAERSILYRNLGGNRFEDVSAATGLVDSSWSGDASVADLNGDLYPDLYVLNMQGDDHFYVNVGGKHFEDRTAEVFPMTPWGSMGIKFFDYNNDGRQDLILTDMHSDMSQQVDPPAEKLKSVITWTEPYLAGGDNNIYGNAFFENVSSDGEMKFEEISDLIGAENYWPWGLSTGDLNADGFEDVFIAASMSYPWRYGVNTVLLNNKGRQFIDSEFILGVEPRKGGATKTYWYTLDCSSEEHRLCAEHPEKAAAGPIEVHGALGTRSSVIFDFDQDGDLDIVTNEFHTRPQVLVSDLAANTQPRFLEIKLVGSASNRDGLGATVRVHAGGKTYARVHDGKSGYLSQSSMPLYVGLGDAAAVDRVEVVWPSGRKQTVTENLAINDRLEIAEPSEAPPGG
ncbi:MAG: CRTAC1 family protein [Thermoanaerobaculia bacterium]